MSALILLTIAGAFLQNLRSLLQRRLTGNLSVNGAAYVRFLFALPFAWFFFGHSRPLRYLQRACAKSAVFSLRQRWGNSTNGRDLCLSSCCERFSLCAVPLCCKTEAVQAALLGLILLGEGIAPKRLAASVSAWRAFFCSPAIFAPKTWFEPTGGSGSGCRPQRFWRCAPFAIGVRAWRS